jgi:hypothetical protein
MNKESVGIIEGLLECVLLDDPKVEVNLIGGTGFTIGGYQFAGKGNHEIVEADQFDTQAVFFSWLDIRLSPIQPLVEKVKKHLESKKPPAKLVDSSSERAKPADPYEDNRNNRAMLEG